MRNLNDFLFKNRDYEYIQDENKDNFELVGVAAFSYTYGQVIPSISFIKKIDN